LIIHILLNSQSNMNTSRLLWRIPLEFIRDTIPLIVLPAFVNESGPLQFILDTGNATAPMILSRQVAERLNIEAHPSSEFPAPSVVGSDPTELLAATARSVSLGPFRAEGIRVGVSKAIDQLSRAIGKEIDGNIGYPFLKDFRITIDFPRKTIRFRRSQGSGEDPGAFDFDLGSPKPLILISAMANSRGPYRFALDTGAGSTIVSRELAQELHLSHGTHVPIQGAGGAATGFLTQLSSLEFGTISLRDVTAVAADVFGSLRSPVGGELDGIIGYNVMQLFRITIDYPMKRVRFES
jgi:predicted aspartyl protease